MSELALPDRLWMASMHIRDIVQRWLIQSDFQKLVGEAAANPDAPETSDKCLGEAARAFWRALAAGNGFRAIESGLLLKGSRKWSLGWQALLSAWSPQQYLDIRKALRSMHAKAESGFRG
jgi:hypothetical protein